MLVYAVSGGLMLVGAQRVMRFSRAAGIALLVSPLLFTGRALLTGAVYAPIDLAYTSEPLASMAAAHGIRSVKDPAISDVYAQFMPWRDALRRSIANHEWPLWNPYASCGEPLAGAAQSAPYHPFTLIALLVPLPQSFAVTASLMFLASALFAFLLFREFVRSETAALFGAFGWMASAHIVFFAGTALALAASAMPLVLLGARRIARDPSRKSVAILTAGLLLVVLAGHPESVLHIVAFGVAYFGFEAWECGALRRPRVYLAGLASGVFALLLSAMFLLPLFDVIAQSEEYAGRSPLVQATPSAPQMAHALAASFFPFLEGAPGIEEPPNAVTRGWVPTAYAGALIFAAAAIGLARSRSRERWFFGGAVLWGLAAGTGVPGFAQLMAHLPGFSISVNDRMIAFAALGFCALAAIGIDAAIDAADRRVTFTFAAIAVLYALIAVAIPSGMTGNYLRITAARTVLPLILAACAATVVPKRALGVVLVALLLLQRGGEDLRFQPTLPASAFYPPFPGLEILRSNPPSRIVASGAMFTPETATHYGLEDVRAFEAVTFARLSDTFPLWCTRQGVWSNRVDRFDSPILSLMNVRYAIIDPHESLPPWWRTRASYPGYAIVENTRVLPRAFVPGSVRTVASAAESLTAMQSIADFGEESVIETDAGGSSANGPGVVSVDGHHLHAHMSAPGWVVISNAKWNGWRATEHGRRIPLRFANHVFTALYLDSGDHDVELAYVPRPFITGSWISAITLLLLLAYTAIPSSAITFFMSFQTSFFAEGVRSR